MTVVCSACGRKPGQLPDLERASLPSRIGFSRALADIAIVAAILAALRVERQVVWTDSIHDPRMPPDCTLHTAVFTSRQCSAHGSPTAC